MVNRRILNRRNRYENTYKISLDLIRFGTMCTQTPWRCYLAQHFNQICIILLISWDTQQYLYFLLYYFINVFPRVSPLMTPWFSVSPLFLARYVYVSTKDQNETDTSNTRPFFVMHVMKYTELKGNSQRDALYRRLASNY